MTRVVGSTRRAHRRPAFVFPAPAGQWYRNVYPIHVAAYAGADAVLDFLTMDGSAVDLHVMSDGGTTALLWGAVGGRLEVVERFEALGLDVHQVTSNFDNSPLHLASINGTRMKSERRGTGGCVRLGCCLLAGWSSDPRLIPLFPTLFFFFLPLSNPFLPPFFFLLLPLTAEFFDALVAKGLDPTARNREDMTPLLWAAYVSGFMVVVVFTLFRVGSLCECTSKH